MTAAPPVTSLVTSVLPAADVPQAEWDGLARAAGALFATPAWVRAVDAVLAPGRVLVATARRGDRLVGVLPVEVRRVAGTPVVRFAGTGPSDYGTVPVAVGVAAGAVVAGLLDALERHLGRAVVLDLQQVSDLDATGAAVRAWARSRGRAVRVVRQAETIRRELGPADAKDSKNRRAKDRRTLRRLAGLGEVEVCPDLLPDPLPDPAAVDALVAELDAVDAAHPHAGDRNRPWTGTRGRFLTEFLRAAPPGGRWLTGVRVDGRLVAYSVELVAGSTVGTYLCSYRAEVAEAAVGTMLLHDARRRAHAQGAVVVDMLRGLEGYKHLIATSTHVSRRVLVLPHRALLPLAPVLAWRQELRPLVRRWRARRAAPRPQDPPTSSR
ncbi:GNAT family N-acetyltransferase [Kineococcus sp. SYSU DK001]|uniref:GNAT family N-acetyltransferase n=1 Tax=Kineococcus sp. SYSU DK001 TaxID=3383122 RepID=UPI003D7D0E3A